MRIAILDDDRELCAHIAVLMRELGHVCVEFTAGKSLMRALRQESFDLLLLDWEVPDFTGIEIVGWVRQNLDPSPPVIMITARSRDQDIVSGLEAGADDYVMKPVQANVLAARVAAVLRRSYSQSGTPEVESFGAYRFSHLTESVEVNDVRVETTAKEFHLALLLFRNIHRSLSRAHILEAVWGRNPDLPTRTLDVHISQIRGRLMLRPQNGVRLSSVYSFGYRLESVELGEDDG